MSAPQAETPSPARQVAQYEADEAMARRMQQAYDDEIAAARVQANLNIEDEFAAATNARNEQLSERVMKRMGQ